MEASDRATWGRGRASILRTGHSRTGSYPKTSDRGAGPARRQALRQRSLAFGRCLQAAGATTLARPSLPDTIQFLGVALQQAHRLVFWLRRGGAPEGQVHARGPWSEIHQLLLTPQYASHLPKVEMDILYAMGDDDRMV